MTQKHDSKLCTNLLVAIYESLENGGDEDGKTHFKQLVDPRYLGAYSLPQGQDIILTIREIRRETVTMMGGQKEECTIAYWMESEKPAILNVTNMKMIAKIYKTPYVEDWVGKKCSSTRRPRALAVKRWNA